MFWCIVSKRRYGIRLEWPPCVTHVTPQRRAIWDTTSTVEKRLGQPSYALWPWRPAESGTYLPQRALPQALAPSMPKLAILIIASSFNARSFSAVSVGEESWKTCLRVPCFSRTA